MVCPHRSRHTSWIGVRGPSATTTVQPAARSALGVTGDRPTGRLHIGHHFGSLANRVRLQEAGVDTFVVIADYQVITDRDAVGPIRERVLSLLVDDLAVGLDPARCTIFTHSAVPALNQLMRSFAARHGDDPRTLLLVDPGWVQTELGGAGAPLGVDESVSGVVDTILAHQGEGGLRFVDHQDQTVPW